MKTKILFSLILLLCSSCTNKVSSTTPELKFIDLPEEQGIVEIGDLEYQLEYQDDNRAIRKAYLGDIDNWKWVDFGMPQTRIKVTDTDLGFGHDLAFNCYEQLKTEEWCTQKLEIVLENGDITEYILKWEYANGGDSILIRNGEKIWEGHMNGGLGFAIPSSKQIGDEIAIDYRDSNYDGENPEFWWKESILLTHGKTVIDIVDTEAYSKAFAPNEILGMFAYFAEKDGKVFLVFNGKEIGEGYDRVFNQYECWDGPPIQIAGDGNILDFFAVKNGAWYHVQVGQFDDIGP
jgi:hypothetical protein